jgi:heme exporter protein B
MNRAMRQAGWLILKDIRIEARARQTLGLVVVLGILIVSVLGLSLGPQQASGAGAAGVLWAAYLFSGVLCFEKTMAWERMDGALVGLLLAPVDHGILYLAKLTSNVLMMLAVCAVVTPVAILFFHFDLSAAPIGFLIIVILSMLGFAALGTLFAAVVSSSRLQGGLLAVVVFPLTLPLVIASTRMMLGLYEKEQSFNGAAFAVLLAFDVIFLVVSWLAFEWVIEP